MGPSMPRLPPNPRAGPNPASKPLPTDVKPEKRNFSRTPSCGCAALSGANGEAAQMEPLLDHSAQILRQLVLRASPGCLPQKETVKGYLAGGPSKPLRCTHMLRICQIYSAENGIFRIACHIPANHYPLGVFLCGCPKYRNGTREILKIPMGSGSIEMKRHPPYNGYMQAIALCNM